MFNTHVLGYFDNFFILLITFKLLFYRPIHPVIFTSPYLKTEELKVTPMPEIYKRLTDGVDVVIYLMIFIWIMSMVYALNTPNNFEMLLLGNKVHCIWNGDRYRPES